MRAYSLLFGARYYVDQTALIFEDFYLAQSIPLFVKMSICVLVCVEITHPLGDFDHAALYTRRQ